MVLKMTVGSIEREACLRLVAGIEVHDRNPDPIDAAQLALRAAGVSMIANLRNLAADRFLIKNLLLHYGVS
jgi:hypothetical protein